MNQLGQSLVFKSLAALGFLILLSAPSVAQSIRKLERRAINRTRITAVNGDSVQYFELTTRHYRARRHKVYYWYANDQVKHAEGDYNGRLLHGPYRLVNRAQQPLMKGTYKKGLKSGRWLQWQPNGTLASTSRWRHGRQAGPLILYGADGKALSSEKPRPDPAATPVTWQSRLGRMVPHLRRHPKPAVTADAPTQTATVSPQAQPEKDAKGAKPGRRKKPKNNSSEPGK